MPTRAVAAAAGTEAGIALALTALPGVFEEINRAAPIVGDRILVEQGLSQQLAAQGVRRPRVRTTHDGLVIGPLDYDDLLPTLAAAISRTDHLPPSDNVTLRFADFLTCRRRSTPSEARRR